MEKILIFILGVIFTLGCFAQDSVAIEGLTVSVFEKKTETQNALKGDTLYSYTKEWYDLKKFFFLPQKSDSLSDKDKKTIALGDSVKIGEEKIKKSFFTIGSYEFFVKKDGVLKREVNYLWAYLFLFFYYFSFSLFLFLKIKKYDAAVVVIIAAVAAFAAVAAAAVIAAAAFAAVAAAAAAVIAAAIVGFFENRNKSFLYLFIVFSILGQGIISYEFNSPEFVVITIISIAMSLTIGHLWEKRKNKEIEETLAPN